ncbi:ABC transporter permease subunit [Pseudoneobacillus sp. C159]
MNVFWREMKAHSKSLIIWCIGVILLVFSGMNKYDRFSGTGQSMNDLIADMPKSLQAFMGSGGFDLSKVTGYYGVLYLYLILIATIHAVILGATIISKEERDKTAEFLFVKPISRRSIITSKLTAATAQLLIFNMITFISSILVVDQYGKGEEGVFSDISILMIGMFFLQLLFMVIGSGLASVLPNPKRAGALSTGILLLFFILSIVNDLNDYLNFLEFVTPYKYFDAKNLLHTGQLDPVFTCIALILIGVLVLITYVFFQKRDLK